jgi:branched-chain amino acid transport system substrate-binding protein
MAYKRVALLGEDTDYGTGFAEWVKKYGQETGIEVKTIIFPRAITDLTPALLETKAWKPDFIINVGVGTTAYLMVSQA